MRIYKHGNFAAIDTEIGVITAEITNSDRSPFSGVQPYFADAALPVRVGEFLLLNLGANNTLPEDIRKILDENHITPELLNKQTQLLWGQGPELYETKIENGQRIKKWVEATEIRNWLKSWDYEEYLLKATVEFRTMNGHFSKYFRNRGARIGQQPKIAKLEHVSCKIARLEWAGPNMPAKRIIVGDYTNFFQDPLRPYPVFDRYNPFENPISMRYSNLYSFALDHGYSVPPIYPLMNWINLASSLPILLNSFNSNSAAIRYHIQSPSIYWQQKRDQLKKNCELKNVPFTEDLFEELKTTVYQTFAEGLVGIVKAGKMITSETVYDDIAQEYVGWKVEVLDQKVKNYIDAQINLAKRADFGITAGFGLHPALSNMSADGNLPSGSEQLYAFKLYLKTAVDIPESIVCKDINNAIQANFPGTNVHVGFYHDTVLAEEDTTRKERVRNT